MRRTLSASLCSSLLRMWRGTGQCGRGMRSPSWQAGTRCEGLLSPCVCLFVCYCCCVCCCVFVVAVVVCAFVCVLCALPCAFHHHQDQQHEGPFHQARESSVHQQSAGWSEFSSSAIYIAFWYTSSHTVVTKLRMYCILHFFNFNFHHLQLTCSLLNFVSVVARSCPH